METNVKQVVVFTDGSCLGNPGPGGYGVVLLFGERRKELSVGYCRTTNNRMELRAAIAGLGVLRERCHVLLHADSALLVKAMRLGWARRWREHGWRRSRREPVLKTDLWTKLLDHCDAHDVEFRWIAGHTGNRENERSHQLATAAATGHELARENGCEARTDNQTD
jgi:ribonuclease HI